MCDMDLESSLTASKVDFGKQKLDYYLPKYDFFEKHSMVIDSSPEKVFEAIHNCDMSESRIIRFLFSLRAVFELFKFNRKAEQQKQTKVHTEAQSFFDQMTKENGFMFLLEEIQNKEVIIGFAGKFWRPKPKIIPLTSVTDFINFNEPGNGKAAWNLYLADNGDGTVALSTETRVLTLGGEAKWFRLYWAVIKPFSGWIRFELLRLIKKRAENH